MTSNPMFTLHYINNLSLTQKIKIPSSLDVIFEWQTALSLFFFSLPSPWVPNKAEASLTVLCTYLSVVMVSAETDSPLQRVFAWELVQNNTGKVLTAGKYTYSHRHLTMMSLCHYHLQTYTCFLLLHMKLTSDSFIRTFIIHCTSQCWIHCVSRTSELCNFGDNVSVSTEWLLTWEM